MPHGLLPRTPSVAHRPLGICPLQNTHHSWHQWLESQRFLPVKFV
ncbi:Hypothetical protein AA314_00552 [Archangium gephyra]|uniref:Uncharacterized protein n=1 Tax=Archangium gephyra TaxID=48 RepID=A0AAC8Q155_9BACT|nr:Hypothetical protein AA314_00552 [Archangium gephyra]